MGEFNVGRKGYLGCWHMDWVLKEQEFFFWLKSRIYWWVCLRRGRPRWLSGKESTWQFRKHRRRGFNPWVRMIPWSRKQQPTPILLPGKFHGQRNLAGYSPWGHKELDITEHTTKTMSKEGTALRLCWLQRLSFVQGSWLGMCLTCSHLGWAAFLPPCFQIHPH